MRFPSTLVLATIISGFQTLWGTQKVLLLLLLMILKHGVWQMSIMIALVYFSTRELRRCRTDKLLLHESSWGVYRLLLHLLLLLMNFKYAAVINLAWHILPRLLSFYEWLLLCNCDQVYLVGLLESAKRFLGIVNVQVFRQVWKVVRYLFKLLDCTVAIVEIRQDLAYIELAQSEIANIASEPLLLLLLMVASACSVSWLVSVRGYHSLLTNTVASLCFDKVLFGGSRSSISLAQSRTRNNLHG